MPKSSGFVDIKVIGDKRLQRKLKQLPLKVQKKVVRRALRESAKPVLERAKATAPRDTGAMARTLKLRAAKAKRGTFGIRVAFGTREKLGIDPADPYFYPAAVELGTSKLPAQPFLRPALKSLTPKVLRDFGGIARREITREAKKL